MSSGISIEEDRLKPASPETLRPGDGFHAWHFFVLASILLATVAVFAARRTSPENLILLSITVAAAGAVAAALYRTLVPLVSHSDPVPSDRLTGRRRATLERDKMLVLRSIKELEFDRAMGKLSQKDFDEMASRLRSRAVALMRQLEAGAGYADVIEKQLQERMGRLTRSPEPWRMAEPACTCGTVNDVDAVFCKKCGTRLQGA